MIVLDTNIIVALLDRKDAHHKRVVNLLEEIGDEKVYMLGLNLGEAYSVIARRCRERNYDCKKALEQLRKLESNLNVIWIENHEEIHKDIVDIVLETGGKLNYNDGALLNFVRNESAELVTLDNSLKKAYETDL